MAKWQTAKVFISSTFRDMHAESDHLVKVVLPQLRERRAPDRTEHIDIDLRWDVIGEYVGNHRALDACRRWIDLRSPIYIRAVRSALDYIRQQGHRHGTRFMRIL